MCSLFWVGESLVNIYDPWLSFQPQRLLPDGQAHGYFIFFFVSLDAMWHHFVSNSSALLSQ